MHCIYLFIFIEIFLYFKYGFIYCIFFFLFQRKVVFENGGKSLFLLHLVKFFLGICIYISLAERNCSSAGQALKQEDKIFGEYPWSSHTRRQPLGGASPPRVAPSPAEERFTSRQPPPSDWPEKRADNRQAPSVLRPPPSAPVRFFVCKKESWDTHETRPLSRSNLHPTHFINSGQKRVALGEPPREGGLGEPLTRRYAGRFAPITGEN